MVFKWLIKEGKRRRETRWKKNWYYIYSNNLLKNWLGWSLISECVRYEKISLKHIYEPFMSIRFKDFSFPPLEEQMKVKHTSNHMEDRFNFTWNMSYYNICLMFFIFTLMSIVLILNYLISKLNSLNNLHKNFFYYFILFYYNFVWKFIFLYDLKSY